MWSYHFRNALRSMKRNPALTALMIAAIAVGIGVSMTMVTIYYIMDGDPIPRKSTMLYRVQVDSWNPLRPFDDDHPERAPHQMTWRDATNLLAAEGAARQVAMFESTLVVEPEGQLPFEAATRVTNGDFFAMFDVPFRYGAPWERGIDRQPAPVVVLNARLNDKLFGGENSVGRRVQLSGTYYTVTGVTAKWEPMPRFYDVIGSPFDDVEDLFVPISLTEQQQFRSSGSTWGWKNERIDTFQDRLNSEMTWLQYWAELPGASDREAYMAHLTNYVNEQKKLGRFERPVNNAIHDVMAWMRYNEVVVDEVKVLISLGFLFFVVCLLSCVSLLLTKVNGHRSELSLRRALGASRSQVLLQNLVEVAIVGGAGGLLGIGLAHLGLTAIQAGISQAPDHMFRIDWVIVGLSIAISVSAAVIAGLYPAWKACEIAPASELKAQ